MTLTESESFNMLCNITFYQGVFFLPNSVSIIFLNGSCCTCRSKRSHSLHPGNASFDSASSLIGDRTSPQKGLLNRSLDTAAYEKAKSAPKGFLNKSFDERTRRAGDSRSTTPTPEATSPKVLRKHTSTPSPRSEVDISHSAGTVEQKEQPRGNRDFKNWC